MWLGVAMVAVADMTEAALVVPITMATAAPVVTAVEGSVMVAKAVVWVAMMTLLAMAAGMMSDTDAKIAATAIARVARSARGVRMAVMVVMMVVVTAVAEGVM